jgi:hypothetical protein
MRSKNFAKCDGGGDDDDDDIIPEDNENCCWYKVLPVFIIVKKFVITSETKNL